MYDEILGGGASAFVNQGTNGRWKDILSPQDVALADQLAWEHLPPDCAQWLSAGTQTVDALC